MNKEDMVKEKRRSDSEIIAMVTQAGITFEDEDEGEILFEVITAFADDESGKIYFVCGEEGKNNGEVVFFYHYAGEVNIVEEDAEFDMIAQVYEDWMQQPQ